VNILICTIVRDRVQALPKWKSQMEALIKALPDYTFDVAVYENDSKDGSDKFIEKVKVEGASKLFAKTEELGTTYYESVHSMERVDLLAKARNACMSLPGNLEKYTSILWIEPDIIYSTEDAVKIITVAIEEKFDILSPLSWMRKPGVIYDTWATRPPQAPVSYIHGEFIIPLFSTFNCFCIYNAQPFIEGVEFSGGDCDTVQICASFRENGYVRIAALKDCWVHHVENLTDPIFK